MESTSGCTATGLQLVEAIIAMVPRIQANEVPPEVGRPLYREVSRALDKLRAMGLLNELVGRLPPSRNRTQLSRDVAAWMLRARRCQRAPADRRLQIAPELLALDFPESPRRIFDHLFDVPLSRFRPDTRTRFPTFRVQDMIQQRTRPRSLDYLTGNDVFELLPDLITLQAGRSLRADRTHPLAWRRTKNACRCWACAMLPE
ncbi:MAG: hypothetical protein IPK63_19360 [Candidatus Competibacteraceae bacterium]|nr:hypothetical protein [Candidatus Competibacteraceae bacterium]